MAATQEISKGESREVAALRSAALTGEAVPQRVLLAPWGQVESTNGSFVVDEESMNLSLRAFDEHGTDLPIDYEHQTLGGTYSSPNGQAPAAGWVKRLLAEPGVGLVAEIEWTDQAERMLAAREYRYLSPVAIIRKTDRKLVAIHSAALTNKPAIVGMRPIINRAETPSGEDRAEPFSVLRAELDLPDDAAPEEVLLAASQRLADLEREARQSQVEQRVQEAVRAGKLVEAQRAWAEALVAREDGLFDEWLRTAPVIVQRGSLVPPDGTNTSQQRERATAARARTEFRAHPMLARLTSEEAYVADALSRAAC